MQKSSYLGIVAKEMYFSSNMFKRIIFYLLFINFIVSSTNGFSGKPNRVGMMEAPRDLTFKLTNNTNTSQNGNESTLLNSVLMSSPVEQVNSIHSRKPKNCGMPLVNLGGSFYYFGTYFKANFFKAMEFCRSHGMNLLSIESEEENSWIINYINKYLSNIEHFWTSGSDLGEEGHFVWLATGHTYNFTYWSPPNPDNYAGAENCMEIWKINGKHIWNDNSCVDVYNFICEMKDCSEFCL